MWIQAALLEQQTLALEESKETERQEEKRKTYTQ